MRRNVFFKLVEGYKEKEEDIVKVVIGSKGIEHTPSKLHENETRARENNCWDTTKV